MKITHYMNINAIYSICSGIPSSVISDCLLVQNYQQQTPKYIKWKRKLNFQICYIQYKKLICMLSYNIVETNWRK